MLDRGVPYVPGLGEEEGRAVHGEDICDEGYGAVKLEELRRDVDGGRWDVSRLMVCGPALKADHTCSDNCLCVKNIASGDWEIFKCVVFDRGEGGASNRLLDLPCQLCLMVLAVGERFSLLLDRGYEGVVWWRRVGYGRIVILESLFRFLKK